MTVKTAELLNKLGLSVIYDGDKQMIFIEKDRKKAANLSR